MCAHLVPYCGQWCIAWQLTDEALTFYSGPCGQFSASRNCGGRLPLTLECSDELWPCGRIIKRSRGTQAKGMRAGCRCSGRGGDGRLRIKDSLMIPLCDSLAPSVSSFPCSHLRSFIACGCLWGGLSVTYPHHALCWWLSLATSKRKLVRQFPSFRKFKICNCRDVMGADSSPIRVWKAAAIEAESNRPFDQQKSFKAELHSVPPVALMLHTVVSHCEGVKCDFFSLWN